MSKADQKNAALMTWMFLAMIVSLYTLLVVYQHMLEEKDTELKKLKDDNKKLNDANNKLFVDVVKTGSIVENIESNVHLITKKNTDLEKEINHSNKNIEKLEKDKKLLETDVKTMHDFVTGLTSNVNGLIETMEFSYTMRKDAIVPIELFQDDYSDGTDSSSDTAVIAVENAAPGPFGVLMSEIVDIRGEISILKEQVEKKDGEMVLAFQVVAEDFDTLYRRIDTTPSSNPVNEPAPETTEAMHDGDTPPYF
jgi:hypothetical protein